MPAELSWLEAGALVALSFLTSGITATLGVGGGVVFLTVLAMFVPASVAIPVHGVVQLASNLGRVVVYRRSVVWSIAAPFAAGSVAGSALGGGLAMELPERALQAALALFVLYATWGRLALPLSAARRGVVVLAGGVTGVLTMFVGATGPFVASLLAPRLDDRHGLVGTHAACMLAQHGIKVAAFGALGFAFGPWLPLLAAIVVAGFFGTLAGARIMRRLPERRFRQALKTVLTALAAYLLARAAGMLP